jgi:hypothetical protein
VHSPSCFFGDLSELLCSYHACIILNNAFADEIPPHLAFLPRGAAVDRHKVWKLH